MQTYAETDIQEIPLSSPIFRKRVETFLAANGLRFEEVDSYYALLDGEGGIIAGAGLCKDVIKCVAVDSKVRSGGLMVPLISHVINQAAAQGITNLKVFTKPENESVFASLGFHLVAGAPKAILMENGRGLEEYLRGLTAAGTAAGLRSYSAAAQRGWTRPGPESSPATGVIIMNANPFTLGHEYLVRKAHGSVDRLFVIPVRDSLAGSAYSGKPDFPYEERLAMIKAGCGSMATVLEGSAYQISEITFPTYFLKDLSEASETQIRLDLDLFGRHIAPALGATFRFVGNEPSDPLTARYNELMKEILPAYGIKVVEIPRLTASSDNPVSASEVRQALVEGSFMTAAYLTPPSTWPYLVAELISRALRMELDTPLKPGLVDRNSTGAHSDMDYDMMLSSIDVIRRSFARHLPYFTARRDFEDRGEALRSIGKAIEADVLACTGGVNTYRGAIFALGLASVAALELAGGRQVTDNQSDNKKESGCTRSRWFSAEELSLTISRLANLIEPAVGSHGAKAVNEYGVKGALQMARDGYKPLFEDWLPYYRRTAGPAAGLHLQKTLLRIMSQLDDTCVIYRVGYGRAQEVKEEAKDLLQMFGMQQELGLKEMKERYDAERISPGGAADMLALTILVDSLLERTPDNNRTRGCELDH